MGVKSKPKRILVESDFAGLPPSYWEWWRAGSRYEDLIPTPQGSILEFAEHVIRMSNIPESVREGLWYRLRDGYSLWRVARLVGRFKWSYFSQEANAWVPFAVLENRLDNLQPDWTDIRPIDTPRLLEWLHFCVAEDIEENCVPDQIIERMGCVTFFEERLGNQYKFYAGIRARIARHAVERPLRLARREAWCREMSWSRFNAVMRPVEDDFEVLW